MDKRIEELLPFYALDALTDEERELVEVYFAEHPEAREQTKELFSAASALPYGVPRVEPPPRSKKELMRRVAADVRVRSSARNVPIRPPVMRGENILRTFTLGIATLAVIWVMILNGQVASLRNDISALNNALVAQANSLQQINEKLSQVPPSPVITVSLKGTDVRPQAQGELITNPSSQLAVLVITGLTPLDPGKTYQVWLIRDVPVSAGLLTVDANGQGVLVVTSKEAIGSFNSLGISIEPKQGSRQPTGDIVVLSNL